MTDETLEKAFTSPDFLIKFKKPSQRLDLKLTVLFAHQIAHYLPTKLFKIISFNYNKKIKTFILRYFRGVIFLYIIGSYNPHLYSSMGTGSVYDELLRKEETLDADGIEGFY